MSFAAMRGGVHEDLAKLAEDHFQHDLQPQDRENLKAAAKTVSTHASVGTLIGLGVGAFLAYRLRVARRQMFAAFRATEKPTHVRFADGREEAIPEFDLRAPTILGDFFATFFFGVGGLFLGGEAGFVTGSWSGRRTITNDPESKARIEKAFARFRADVLRKEIEKLEKDAGINNSLTDKIQFWN